MKIERIVVDNVSVWAIRTGRSKEQWKTSLHYRYLSDLTGCLSWTHYKNIQDAVTGYWEEKEKEAFEEQQEERWREIHETLME
jgi:hypothetical protein